METKASKFFNKENIGLIFSFVITVATVFNIFLWVNNQQQLDFSRKAEQGNLLITLNRDLFFNDRMYALRKEIESDNPVIFQPKGQFVLADVDDYIGIFYMVDDLMQRGILDKNIAIDNFCDWAVEANSNNEIKGYINSLRKDPSYGFDKFDHFLEECSR